MKIKSASILIAIVISGLGLWYKGALGIQAQSKHKVHSNTASAQNSTMQNSTPTLAMKRSFQPSHLKRKRKQGFRTRVKSKGVRKVLRNRRRKGLTRIAD